MQTPSPFKYIIPVDFAIAPIASAGTETMRQQAAALNDIMYAAFVVLAERTLWKYTCHGIAPNT